MEGTRPCPACGHQVARSASPFNCPGCGRLIRFGDLDTPEERERNQKGCWIMLAILLVILFLACLPYLMETPEQRRRAEDDAIKRSLGVPSK